MRPLDRWYKSIRFGGMTLKLGRLGFATLISVAFGYLAPLGAANREIPMPVGAWRVVKRESGPVNYYTVHKDASPPYIHAEYHPPLETVVMGFQVADVDRPQVRALKWKWRAITLPKGGNECAKGKGDSAAVIYVSWKRFLKWYALKYVWTTESPKGAVCDKKSSPFMAQDTVILESGGPLNTWRDELIDLDADFRKHFADGDPNADVPDFMGVGIMTDGDQTNSESAADYADFRLIRR